MYNLVIKKSHLIKYTVLSLAAALFFFTACGTTGSTLKIPDNEKSKISNILSVLPAQDKAEETRINTELVNSGPQGIKYICTLLTPPGVGDDTNERYAINGLAWHVHRPGAEEERLMYANSIIEATDFVKDNEVKSFLIRQLQFAGKEESVMPLSKYLYHDVLCEPAVQALVSINTPCAEGTLIEALPENTVKNKITIVKALGDLKSRAAVYEISKYSVSANKDLRMAALYALANIGPFSTENILADAVISEKGYKKSKLISFQLLFAKRLAEAGKKKECAEICRNIIKKYFAHGEENIRISALTVLVETIGEDALWDLIYASEDENKEVISSVMELANKIPSTNSSIEWYNKMKSVGPELQKAILAMLNKRDKKYITPVIRLAFVSMPDEKGFVPLFNGKDLTGWKGLVGNPLTRAKMSPEELAGEQEKADELMRAHWKIEDGVLVFDGKGSHLCTKKDYKDFEMLVDWKIGPEGDSGIYLRGSPQVQIWDPAQWPEGSGGLYNNQKNPRKPIACVDNPIGEWNTFRIKMIGERVTVHLNGVLVVDNVIMENYWDRDQPIFPAGQIELQSHGSTLYFRNIKIREIDEMEAQKYLRGLESGGIEEGFVSLFNGRDFTGWIGATGNYIAEDGKIVCPADGGGNLYTEKEYSDFILRFEFRLSPGANNGLGIRAPLQGDAAYVGMELQILDDTADKYKNLQPYQYHGSIYGVVPAKRGYLKTVGSWNYEEVIVKGKHVTVKLNDVTIVDADIDKASTPKTIDGKDHPGLKRETGHIGFLGHGSLVEFRNIRIKELR